MTFIQILILCLWGAVIMGIVWRFRTNKRRLQQKHLEWKFAIINTLYEHRTQLKIRNDGLQKYNFLEYNLGESLVVQPTIQL